MKTRKLSIPLVKELLCSLTTEVPCAISQMTVCFTNISSNSDLTRSDQLDSVAASSEVVTPD